MTIHYNALEANKGMLETTTLNQTSSDGTQPSTITEKLRRLGYLTCLLLLLSTLGNLAFVGYISFLWFAADGNYSWRSIALAGWTTRSVAVASVVLRASVTVQAGIASSMLAGILLEGPGVRPPKLAAFSIMRATGPAPYTCLKHMWSSAGTKKWLFSGLAAILSITSLFLQFTSTILLADIDIGYVTGKSVPYPITFAHDASISSPRWSAGVHRYPTFAEYAEGEVSDGSSGLSDTGPSLRAFLPIGEQGNRTAIHKYTGPAVVLDSRVVCMRPNITNLEVHFPRDQFNNPKWPVIHGNITIPRDLRGRAEASRVFPNSYAPYHPFFCQVSANIEQTSINMYHGSETWNLTMCWVDPAGIIRSAFKDNSKSLGLSKTYILMNFTTDIQSLPRTDNGSYAVFGRLFNDSIPGLAYHDRGDWVDVYRDDNETIAVNATSEQCPPEKDRGNCDPEWITTWNEYRKNATKLSFSMCFPSFDPHVFNISAASKVPLVEPSYTYDIRSDMVRFDDVRKQLLTTSNYSLGERGILALAPQDWTIDKSQGFEYLNVADLDHILRADWKDNSNTLHLRHDGVHFSIGGLLLEVLRTGGTTAEAVQAMLMAAIASRYQDSIFAEGDNGTATPYTQIKRTNFVAVQIPGGQNQLAVHPVGTTLSYSSVMVVVFIHCTVVWTIIMWFLKATNFTLLGESWSNIAQIITPTTIGYLDRASCVKDSEVRAWMQEDGIHAAPIKIGSKSRVQEEGASNLRQRTRRGFAQQTESEQDILMDDLRPRSPSTAETTVYTAETPGPTVAVVDIQNTPTANSSGIFASPDAGEGGSRHRRERE